MAHHEQLINWLNDAYGMEQSIERVLGNHVKDAKDYPDVQSKLQDHLEKTKCHAGVVKQCIERLGGDVSTLKSTMSTVMGAVQSVSTGPAEDQMVKNALSDYGTEHFEIASYKSLIAAAESSGDQEIVRALQGVLRDEEEMAKYLDENIPRLTLDFYRKKSDEHRRAA